MIPRQLPVFPMMILPHDCDPGEHHRSAPLGAHPKKTIVVSVGKVKSFSDIGGRHMVRLTNDQASRNSFANRLAQKCPALDRIGNDWMHVGKFEPTEPKPAKKKSKKR